MSQFKKLINVLYTYAGTLFGKSLFSIPFILLAVLSLRNQGYAFDLVSYLVIMALFIVFVLFFYLENVFFQLLFLQLRPFFLCFLERRFIPKKHLQIEKFHTSAIVASGQGKFIGKVIEYLMKNKEVQKGVETQVSNLGRALSNLNAQVVAAGVTALGGAALYLDHQQRLEAERNYESQQRNFDQSIKNAEARNRPRCAEKIICEKEFSQKIYYLEKAGFIQDFLDPNREWRNHQIEVETQNYEAVLAERREAELAEIRFWMQIDFENAENQRLGIEIATRRALWNSLSFPEKLKRHVEILLGTIDEDDVIKDFIIRILQIFILKGSGAVEEAVVNMFRRDTTHTGQTNVSSPLESQVGLVAVVYNHLLLQAASVMHYGQAQQQLLEAEYGDDLDKTILDHYFQVNPFLEQAEYMEALQNLEEENSEVPTSSPQADFEDPDSRPSTSSGLYQEDLDRLKNSSEGENISDGPLYRTDNAADFEQFQKELLQLRREEEIREIALRIKQKALYDSNKDDKGDDKIKAFHTLEEQEKHKRAWRDEE